MPSNVSAAACGGVANSAPAWCDKTQLNEGYFTNAVYNGSSVCSYSQTFSAYSFSSQTNPLSCSYSSDHQNWVLPPLDGSFEATAGIALPSDPAHQYGGGGQGVDTVTALVTVLKHWNSGNNQQKVGSGYIVHSMLGEDGADANTHGGSTISSSEWTDLTARLNAVAGSINWNQSFSTTYNTFMVADTPGNTADIVVDNAGQSTSDSGQPAIVIPTANPHVPYVLFRECANPDGASDGLAKPAPPVVGGYLIDDSGSGDSTIGTKPFKDDIVRASHGATNVDTSGEPFDFSGTSQLVASSYSFAGIDSPPDNTSGSSSWAFEGYTICDTNNAACNSAAWLDNPANITSGATTLVNGDTYNVRLIYTGISCSVTSNPTPVQPGDALSLTYDVTYSSGSIPSPTLDITYPLNSQGNSLGASQTVVPTLAASPPKTLEYTKSGLTAQAAGQYHVTIQLKSGGTPKGAPCATGFSIVTLPYFKVQDSGVSAEGAFDDGTHTCTNPNSGLIAGWNDNTGADRGSSSDYYALADQPTYGFASGFTSGSGLPAFLSIANTTAVSPDHYSPPIGGNYAAGNTPLSLKHCLTSQHEKKIFTTKTGLASVNLADDINYSNGDYQFDSPTSGTLDVGASGLISTGKQISIFVHGNVYISSNIAYNGTGGWASKADIPSVVIVADGAIFISPTVTQLDGLYEATNVDFSTPSSYSPPAAAPGAVPGEIYTCATATGAYKTTGDLYSNCSSQLVVNGSFVATQLNLLRTYGTLRNATSNERYTGPGATACVNDGSGTSSSCAAEVFNFSPEFFLGQPPVGNPTNGIKPYDSITSLPPIL